MNNICRKIKETQNDKGMHKAILILPSKFTHQMWYNKAKSALRDMIFGNNIMLKGNF